MAAGAKILETLAAMLPEGGIKAFHSSPHDFDRFDISKIGTGQGAASYGHGIYAAENPAVSGQGGEYWKEFSRKFGKEERDAADWLALHNFDRQKAATFARAQLERSRQTFSPSQYTPAEEAALERERAKFEKTVKMLEGDNIVGPRTYEVNIKADPNQFLQWDKSLAEQPDIASKLPMFQEAAGKEAYARALASTNKPRADELWKMAKDPLQAPASFGFSQLKHNLGPELSTMMRERGVPGVRYADQRTRELLGQIDNAQNAHRQMSAITGSAPEWAARVEELKAAPQTYNYVVNNDKLIDIMKKYAVPGAAGTGIAAAGSNLPTWDTRGM